MQFLCWPLDADSEYTQEHGRTSTFSGNFELISASDVHFGGDFENVKVIVSVLKCTVGCVCDGTLARLTGALRLLLDCLRNEFL